MSYYDYQDCDTDPLHLFIGFFYFIYHFALVKFERKFQGDNLSNSDFLVNSLEQI